MEEQAPEQKKGGSGKTVAIVGIIVIVLAAAGFAYKSSNKQAASTATPAAPKTAASAAPSMAKSTTTSASGSSATTTYKDGTYTAEGDYTTHVGQKHIKVTITLKKDIITASDVKDEADDQMSTRYQDEFISGYKPMVIGKDISTVKLSKVSGSSLTPNGFNAALQTIQTQAKS